MNEIYLLDDDNDIQVNVLSKTNYKIYETQQIK